MAIITIYQGASGSGEELAEAVAQSLGSWRCSAPTGGTRVDTIWL